MITALTAALLLSATEIEVPVVDLTEDQRQTLPGTARLELTPDQLRTARMNLQRELDGKDLGRKSSGLITAGALSILGGGLVAGFGAALLFIPYANTDGFFAMFVNGVAAVIGGNVMLAIGLHKAGTRASYLERLEELDAQLKTRGAFRDGTSPRSGRKLAAPVIRFTVAEF